MKTDAARADYRISGTREHGDWNIAIEAARRYHARKMECRYSTGLDYDEDGAIYALLPGIVKRAMESLCACGEIQ